MAKRLLIDANHKEEMRVAIADDRQIFDFDFISASKKQVKGNIYLAKITRVEPSLQAAFVEYGNGKQGFLPFAEIHADYYQIPMSDRQKLLEEAEREDEGEAEPAADAPPTAGLDATLRDAPAVESGPGYGTEAEEAVYHTMESDMEHSLPELEAIPEQNLSAEEEAAPVQETQAEPAPTQALEAPKEPTLTFAVSELVAQETIENEALARELADAPEAPESRAEEGVETLDDEEYSARPKRNNFHRRYKIQEVIKRGQIVLVQVIKEERGNKGASLTTYLSLAGRYCVLMPNSPKDGGISRKISDGETRKRLKEMLAELKLVRGMSVIIRTAGIDRTRAEIRRDFDYLVKLWNKIRETTLASSAPALIYEESDLIKRTIRDQYTNDIEEVMVEGEDAFNTARDFMKMLLPSHTPRVKHYRESMPLFYAYGIEEQLLSMHDPIVKLKSGGYIVINPTEALISIDVNSGRSTGERNIEETASKTNLEAAAEVARQLRLRDLAGLIVIDFIDMFESRNRRAVERAMKDALKTDRAKIQLGRISPFGLMEMSRQRMRPSIAESSTIQCPHCVGRGHIRSNESMTIQIVRSLEKEAASGNWGVLKLSVPEHIALHLLNSKRNILSMIEERHGVLIQVLIDRELTASNFTLEKTRRAHGERAETSGEPRERGRRGGRDRDRSRDRDRPRDVPAVNPDDIVLEDLPEEAESEAAESSSSESAESREGRARRRRGRRGGRGRGREERADGTSEPSTEAAGEQDATEAGVESSEEKPERGERRDRGRRGGRGRKRWKDDGESTNDRPATDASEAKPAEALPSFARSGVVEPLPKRMEFAPSNPPAAPAPVQQALSTTARPEGQPPRKGWWQRIIELD